MRSLSKKISIDTWKMIADRVQKLNIYDFSDREFNENLVLLRMLLSDLDICLEYLSRYPTREQDIGLASLLQAIYSSNVNTDYKKANFYEKINQLDILSIPSIQFRPIGFEDVRGLMLTKSPYDMSTISVNKCFTDGDFKIEYYNSGDNQCYDMVHFNDANYLINVLVELDANSKTPRINPDASFAVLRNFDGFYPVKESIDELRFPGLCTYFKYFDDNTRHLILKQIYLKLDRFDTQYSRKLVRTPRNFHY